MAKVSTRIGAGVGIAALIFVALRAAGFIGARPSNTALPLLCKLRGHGWRMPKRAGDMPLRRTCSTCEKLDIPLG